MYQHHTWDLYHLKITITVDHSILDDIQKSRKLDHGRYFYKYSQNVGRLQVILGPANKRALVSVAETSNLPCKCGGDMQISRITY